jgi:hypothetical protein
MGAVHVRGYPDTRCIDRETWGCGWITAFPCAFVSSGDPDKLPQVCHGDGK